MKRIWDEEGFIQFLEEMEDADRAWAKEGIEFKTNVGRWEAWKKLRVKEERDNEGKV